LKVFPACHREQGSFFSPKDDWTGTRSLSGWRAMAAFRRAPHTLNALAESLDRLGATEHAGGARETHLYATSHRRSARLH